MPRRPRADAASRALKERLAASDDWAALAEAHRRAVRPDRGRAVRSLPGVSLGPRRTATGMLARLELVGVACAGPDPPRSARRLRRASASWCSRTPSSSWPADPANSVLLYGDRGTGKSSTVKALLNEHAERGLRLVEVARDDLATSPGSSSSCGSARSGSSCSSTTSRSTRASATTVDSRPSSRAASRPGRSNVVLYADLEPPPPGAGALDRPRVHAVGGDPRPGHDAGEAVALRSVRDSASFPVAGPAPLPRRRRVAGSQRGLTLDAETLRRRGAPVGRVAQRPQRPEPRDSSSIIWKAS